MVKQLIAQHELEVPEGIKVEVKGRRVRVTGPRGAWAPPLHRLSAAPACMAREDKEDSNRMPSTPTDAIVISGPAARRSVAQQLA